MGFGRRGSGQIGFGRKQPNDQHTSTPMGLFRSRGANESSLPFDRLFAQLEREQRDRDRKGIKTYSYQSFSALEAIKLLSPEERGELLSDLADQPGIYDGYKSEAPREKAAYNTYNSIWNHDILVRQEHLGSLLAHLTGNSRFRDRGYYDIQAFDTLLKLINSAIKQGAYLSSSNCEALAQMAVEIRNARSSYSKADTKKMIARAEKLEKLAGVEVSATEFLLERCEGAENQWAIADRERPNAQFWADLLAEVTGALEQIRAGTKGGVKPAWMRNANDFAATWPAHGDIEPRFEALKDKEKPFFALSQHNGKRTGFADPDAYCRLPQLIPLAQAHSRYHWNSTQIPALEVIADLENPDWTALVEKLITQRRATRATAAWQKEVLALCQPLGITEVETRLHNWMALFHTPTLNMAVYTDVCNGERFAAMVDRLEKEHPNWPAQYANSINAFGRAIAMKVASEDNKGICGAFHSQLIRLDDHVYKNTRVTEGVLGLGKAQYKHPNGGSTYETLSSWMRLSVENEEFLRGAVWMVALMPDRARAIDALEKTAQTAATYMWTGDDGMRSKIIANAAIATLIAMRESDIDAAVLRLSKAIDNCTINPPLFKYLNGES